MDSSSSSSSSSLSIRDHFLPSSNPFTHHMFMCMWLYRLKLLRFKLSPTDDYIVIPNQMENQMIVSFNDLRSQIISKIRLSPHGSAINLFKIAMQATCLEFDKGTIGQTRCIFNGTSKLLQTVYLYVPTHRTIDGDKMAIARDWYVKVNGKWKKYIGDISYSQLNPTIPLLYKRFTFVMHRQYRAVIHALISINTLPITIDAIIKLESIEKKEHDLLKLIKQHYDNFNYQYQMIAKLLKHPIIGQST